MPRARNLYDDCPVAIRVARISDPLRCFHRFCACSDPYAILATKRSICWYPSNLFIRSQFLRSLSFENLALPSTQPAIFLTGVAAVELFSTDLPPLWLGADFKQNYSSVD